MKTGIQKWDDLPYWVGNIPVGCLRDEFAILSEDIKIPKQPKKLIKFLKECREKIKIQLDEAVEQNNGGE